MPQLEISSYAVGTHRQSNASNYHRRFLSLEPRHPTSEFQHIVIYFFVQEQIVNDPDIGYQTPGSTKYVVGFAPVSDFDAMYNILQTEKPVYFNWAANSSNRLYWFGLSTTQEPPGEGPRDANA